MSTDDYTADEEAMDALTFGSEAAASWDVPETSSSASDLFLLSTNLRGADGAGGAGGFGVSGLSGGGGELDALHASLFRGYSLQSLGRPAPSASSTQQQQAAASASRSSDLESLLARLESSKRAEALQSGSGTLADLDDADFDTSAMLAKMVDDFGDDEEEVAAAASAASAWGPVPPGYAFDAYAQSGSAAAPSSGPMSTPTKTHIPAPGSSPAPLPVPHSTPMQGQSTPAKGVMSLADLEARLKGASVSGPPGFASPQQSPQQQQQQAQQSPSPSPTQGITYMGPALPHFQHGAPAPQGLSVDEHERQHFYIPLGSSRNLGFMTKSEIALVFRIQLSQLQSIGDPLSDDFYYQVMQARKGGKINSSGQAILPVFKSGQARNEDGSPKLPEGTLGRISAFSIHKPKRLMAIDDAGESATTPPAGAASDEQPRKSNLFSGRTLAYLIEEGYRCLMDLEDVDALLASLAPHRFEDPVRAFDRQRLVAQRAELCTRLLESLDLDELHARMKEVASGEHLVFKFFAQPKGRLLVYRSLVLLNPPSTYQLVDVLMHDMHQIAMPSVAAGSTDEKLAHLLADIVQAMPLLPYANQIFSYFLAPKHLESLIPLMRTQLLCQLLQVLLKKGHEATMLLQNPQAAGMPGIRETVHQWRAIFDHIAAGIQGRIAQLFDGLPKDAKPTLPTTTGQAAKRRGDRKPAGATAAGSADKKEEDKRASPAPVEEKKSEPAAAAPKESYALSTRFGMWELMAAFFSHANEHQRVWINAELKEVLTAELQMLYGEYKDKKEKQAAANVAAAAAEAEKTEADKAASPDAAAAAADGSEAKEENASAAAAGDAAAAPKPSTGRRQPQVVPPASSLPPPPSPALRFLSSALLGEQSAEHASIASTWNDLHNDYMFYMHKHNAKVAQEQARQAQQAQMRAARQAQQQQQWQAYQQRGGHGYGQQQQQRGPGASPNRSHVPPQHQHFHQQGGPARHFQHQPQGQGQGQQPLRGPMQRGQQQGQQQQSQQQQSPPSQAQGPPKPVPVWVKPGMSGAAAVKTPVKAPPAASPAPSPAK